MLYIAYKAVPSWWRFLNSVGRWAYARNGRYVCVICPDDVFSSFAVASSLLEKSLQNDNDILAELASKPAVLLAEDGVHSVRGIYRGLQEIDGHTFCKFERARCIQYVPPSRLDGMIIPKSSSTTKWLQKKETKQRVSQREMNVASARIVGNRVALLEASRMNVFSIDHDGLNLTRSIGDILKIEDAGNIPSRVYAIKILSARGQYGVETGFEIWSGDIPEKEPAAHQSVVCCLAANDGNVASKADRFMEQLTGRMGQLGWKPLIIDGDCQDGEFSGILEHKPANVEIAALEYRG